MMDDKKILPHLEAMHEYRGYTCAVLLMPLGHRCGYVGIPKGKPYYGYRYGKLDFVDCHGGLTYSEDFLKADGVPDGRWWIGFDCMHAYDHPDIEAVRRVFGGKQAEVVERYSLPHGEVRTLGFCERDCDLIVDQLLEAGEDDD